MIILIGIFIILFLVFLKYLDYERNKIIEEQKKKPKKLGYCTEETYIKWKKGQI